MLQLVYVSHPFIKLNCFLFCTTVQQDGKSGKCLAPRPSVEGGLIPSVGRSRVDRMDPTPMLKVSRNLRPVEPEYEVLDLTLPSTEKPANIPNLTILEPTVKDHKQMPVPEKPVCSQVDIAEPYVDIRTLQKGSQNSKACQEVAGCDQYGITMRVPECDPFKEFPGVTLNNFTPTEDNTLFYIDAEKLLTNPKKKVSTFQHGYVCLYFILQFRLN